MVEGDIRRQMSEYCDQSAVIVGLHVDCCSTTKWTETQCDLGAAEISM